MNGQLFRPPGPSGRGDKYLRDVARDVQRVIKVAQRNYHDESLRLRPADLAELSLILAEFAEDLHNDIGIWRSWPMPRRKHWRRVLPPSPAIRA